MKETKQLDEVRMAALQHLRNIREIVFKTGDRYAYSRMMEEWSQLWALIDDGMYWAAEADYGSKTTKND